MMTTEAVQVRFFKLHFDFNVFSAENRRLFSIEFQLHTNSHITLWLPVRQLKAYRLAKYGKVATRRFFDVCTASRSNSPVHTSEDCLFSA